MFNYIVRKALKMLPMLFLLSMIVFFAIELTPMDPINYLISPEMASNTENLELLRESLGLNDHVVVRYGRWLGNILTGDFGYSIVSGHSIIEIIKTALPATFELAFTALLLSTIIGIFLGIIASVYQNGFLDNLLRFISVVSTSIPQFFIGIVLLYFLAIKLDLFPIGGRMSMNYPGILGRLQHLFLPAFTMTIGLIPALMRYTRNSMLDVRSMDYVKTARSKGIPEWKVNVKHIFRNAVIPVVVLLVFRLPSLISGSVILESVFSWPGIGRVITNGINSGDYPVVMVTTLMIAVVIMIASLLVDIFSALLDPRIRLEE